MRAFARFFMAENLRNLRRRTLTGILIVAVTLLAIRFSPHSYLLFLGLLSIGCSFEYFKLTRGEYSSNIISGMVLGTLTFVLHSLYILGFVPGGVLIFLTLIPITLLAQTVFSKHRKPFAHYENILGGLIYTVLPFICLSYLPINPSELRLAKDYTQAYRWEIPMMYFIMLMAHDSLAYLTGRFLGRTKIAKHISPNKTLEGVLGGLVGAALFTFFLKDNLLPLDAQIRQSPSSEKITGDTRLIMNDLDWYVMLALTVFFGVFGDLVESRLKRSEHVKNSSNFFPGHGGFLDRYDSLLISAIPVFLYIYFFKYSTPF